MSEYEWLETFGDNLKNILDEYGYNQKDFADAIGVTEATVSRYINKRSMPSIKALINMSYELDISLDELMDLGGRIN